MKLSKKNYVSLLVIGWVSVFFQSRACAQVDIDIIAITGDAAPTPQGSTNGVFGDFFGGFGNVSINDAGQVLFTAAGIENSANGINDNSGLFLGDTSGVVSIARRGQTVPGAGTFSRNFSAQIGRISFLNNLGQVAFAATIDDDTRNSIFLSDGSSLGVSLVTTPPGRFSEPGGRIVTDDLVTVIADGDFILINSPDQPTDFSIAVSTGTEISGFFGGAVGTSTLAGIETFNFDFNSSGTFVFGGEVSSRSSNGVTQREDGVFRVSGGEVTTLARRATPAPNSESNGDFGSLFSDVAINEAGQAVFLGSVNTDTAGSNNALFFSDGDTPVSIFALEGDAVSFAPGQLFEDFSSPILNDTGQLVFQVDVTDGTALVLADLETGELTPIIQTGDAAPDGDGVFGGRAREVFINDNGQVAFVAELDDSSNRSSVDEGIFLFDPAQGITQVLRDGRDLLGSQVRFFDLEGLNNRGEIGLDFVLEDRRSGVLRASVPVSVPEPSCLLVLGIGGIAIATRRHR